MNKRQLKSLLKQLGFTHKKGSNLWTSPKTNFKIQFTRQRGKTCVNLYGSKEYINSQYQLGYKPADNEIMKRLSEEESLKYGFREINLKKLMVN